MMYEEGIYALYPSVVTIRGGIAYDVNGNVVEYNKQDVDGYFASKQYKINRQNEYPSIEEQLDTLYHGGLAEWKASIKAVKDKYPKP